MRTTAIRSVAAIASAVAVTLAIAAVGGGWIGLGRVDPLLAIPGLGWAAALAVGLGCRRWRQIGATAGAMLVAVAIVGLAWAGHMAWVQLLLLFLAVGAAFTLMRATHGALAPSRLRRALGFTVAALVWQWGMPHAIDRLYAPAAVSAGTNWAVVTSLPLRPEGLDRLLADRSSEAAILRTLSPRRPPVMLERVDAASLAPLDALLLAHPQALDPAALVAIDQWVRQGGTAVILADGLSGWPPRYPLGDQRNPPLTSLLTPLLTHWGVELDAPAGLRAEVVERHSDGSRLTMVSPGRLRLISAATARCRQSLPELAQCRVGQGRAVILADADLLDARLWGGVTGTGGPRNWRSGTAYWLADQLSVTASARDWQPRPLWSR